MSISAYNKRWKLRGAIKGALSPQASVIATLLGHRDLKTPEAIDEFFHASYPGHLHNPLLMKGMDVASHRIAQAIREQEPVAVYGDFDTDGITSVTLLQQALTAFGATVHPYIPLREGEGYGLNKQAINTLAEKGTRLLITVDCGISNATEVAYARDLGLDVIVTDHHTPPTLLPEALAIINPKQPGCPYPYKHLVGVGIAFKLVQSLFKQRLPTPTPIRARDMLDLVALGTVADIGPLDGENRVLVKEGLRALNMEPRLGIRALCQEAGISPGAIDAMTIGYQLAPRLNAAGRMGDARESYELLSTTHQETAARLAKNLEMANRQRQSLTRQTQNAAIQQAQQEGKMGNTIVVLAHEHYPSGIVGLVAARLVEQWNRPVLLIERGEDESRGSARSIPEFNMIAALTTCQDLFLRYGGHSRAAGFTLKTEHLATLEERLLHHAHHQLASDDLFVPVLIIDAVIELDQITGELLKALSTFEPFGEGNPQPLLMSEQVLATDMRAIGSASQHLKFRVSQNDSKPIEAIAFGLGHLAEPLKKSPWIDLVYTLETNSWNGVQTLQLNVRDFRRSGKNHSERG